jgi:signal transduction histidine kinase
MSPEIPMDHSKKQAPDFIPQLRRLAHDLSNSIETIMQASYLLAQTKLDANAKKWLQMIGAATEDAGRINRSIREILRSQQEKSVPRRRAS